MKGVGRLVVALAVPVLLTALLVRLLAVPSVVASAYGVPGFPEAPGLTRTERTERAQVTARYVTGAVDRSTVAALRAPRAGGPLYSEAEIAHLDDVRRIIERTSWAGILAAVVLIAAWAGPWRGRWAGATAAGGWLAVAFPVGVMVGVASAWEWLFVTFHELLFPPDTWTFAMDSGLIRLFPERFWVQAAVVLAVLLAVGGAAVARWTPRRRPGEGPR